MTATATIPVHILHSNVSMTAKLIWLELSLESSKKRPDVIIEPKKLAEMLNRSVATIRRALRELIAAGLAKFKSWVCKNLKVFTLLWQTEQSKSKEPSVTETTSNNKPKATPPSPPPKKPKPSAFHRDEKGILCLKADELDTVREVAYKLVDIGFTKETAIETMNQQTLVVLQKAIEDLTRLEMCGEKISDKVAWFKNRII